ncbi:MAG: VanZ family protein [Muribaculaceae bacterium]|nr:VanZ family protein [Muribaculaceae bacterium]
MTVLSLTCLPAPEMVDRIPMFAGADKLVHAIMFGGVVAALVFDTCRRDPARLTSQRLIVYLLSAVMLGGITELIQATAAISRSGDIYDFIADCFGAIVACLTAPKVCRAIFL